MSANSVRTNGKGSGSGGYIYLSAKPDASGAGGNLQPGDGSVDFLAQAVGGSTGTGGTVRLEALEPNTDLVIGKAAGNIQVNASGYNGGSPASELVFSSSGGFTWDEIARRNQRIGLFGNLCLRASEVSLPSILINDDFIHAASSLRAAGKLQDSILRLAACLFVVFQHRGAYQRSFSAWTNNPKI